MKGNLLKKLNENTPECIKKILSKAIRLKVINNNVFKNQFNEIKIFEQKSNNEKDEIHFRKVKETLIYAYENTDYYKELFDKINFNPYCVKHVNDIRKIPTINKKEVMDNFNKFISREDIDYYIAYTGGSTGKPLKILLDTESIYKEKAFVYNYWSKFGYDFRKSKIITLRGLEFKEKIYKYNPIDNQIILNPFKLNKNNIEEYVNIIEKFNPDIIHGYASAIYNLCRILNSKNLKLNINIKTVCFVSENVNEFEKEYIEKTLNCKSNIFYGHSERIVFAEFLNDSYKFNDLYTHVELIKTEKKDIYSIACTGLISRKMPLINYVPDDYIIYKDNKINIYGHWDKELLIGVNEEKVSMASINFHNEVFEKIKCYQFEQFEKGKVYLNIVEDNELTELDKKYIKSSLQNKLKNIIDIELNIVDQIPLTKRGKYKKVIQHIEH
ncbi:hypothetical protein P5F08_09470 [Clostridium perfringens]|nr:hypothetical protein [Clostridium perfringens]